MLPFPIFFSTPLTWQNTLFTLGLIVAFAVCIIYLFRPTVRPVGAKRRLQWLFDWWPIALCVFAGSLYASASIQRLQVPLFNDISINIWGLVQLLFISSIVLSALRAAFLTGLIHSSIFTENETANAIRERVDEFWNSDDFLRGLKTVLPKGDRDEKRGLDYLPFMLENIELRRERHSASASKFLVITIVFTIIFSSIVVIFGYFLLADNSAGLPRAVYKLESTLDKASKDSEILKFRFLQSDELKQLLETHIKAIDSFKDDDALKEKYSAIVGAIDRLRSKGDLDVFLKEVNLNIADLSEKKDDNKLNLQFIKIIQNLSAELSSLERIPSLHYSDLVNQIKTINNLLNDKSYSPDQRGYELWRRLGLGIVICTFFFAVIRYFASLYKQQHLEQLKAEKDDLAARQLVVALRAAGHDIKSRRVTLASLVSNESKSNADDTKSDLSGEEAGVLKELISGIMKKLQ